MAGGKVPWLKYAVDTQLLDTPSDISRYCGTGPSMPSSAGSRTIRPHTGADIGEHVTTGTPRIPGGTCISGGYRLSVKDIGLEKKYRKSPLVTAGRRFVRRPAGHGPRYYCISARVLASIAKAGYADDARVKKYLKSILDSQRWDGGWHCSLGRAKGNRSEDFDSCPLDNANILLFLGQYGEFRQTGGLAAQSTCSWRTGAEGMRGGSPTGSEPEKSSES